MRRITDTTLWLGHVGDARDPRALSAAGIDALVDLALDEPATPVQREAAYCRFPLLDGGGNPPWLLKAAISTSAQLIRSRTRTLVFCGAGMSRSPSICAAAMSIVDPSRTPQEWLEMIITGHPADVSPGLWNAALAAVAVLRAGPIIEPEETND